MELSNKFKKVKVSFSSKGINFWLYKVSNTQKCKKQPGGQKFFFRASGEILPSGLNPVYIRAWFVANLIFDMVAKLILD